MTRIVFYLARADNGVIGREGALPWHLPADLRRFKAMTMAKPMLMGRRTWDALGRALPGRRHLVMTRDPAWSAPGAERVAGLDEALALIGDAPELAIAGGAEIYRQLLPRADGIELTEIHLSPDGDAVVPPFTGWRETFREDHPAEDGRPAYSFVTLVPPAA